MATLRELKGRIGSVASSEKITGAMKMISSAKMHKAEQALKRLQPFRQQVEEIIGSILSTDATFSSPLIESRDVKHLTIVVFGSDDGLCGAYNVNIFKQLAGQITSYRQSFGDDLKISIVPVGSKIAKAVAKICGGNIAFQPAEGVDSKTSGQGVKKFINTLRADFEAGRTDRIDCLYMNFKSVSRQHPEFIQILPVVNDTFAKEGVKQENRPYIFEPSPNAIFQTVLPMFLLAVLNDIFTENRASEQAARVMAMQSANDNAKKLLEQLQLEYNKLRQQSITTELLDILGGQVR